MPRIRLDLLVDVGFERASSFVFEFRRGGTISCRHLRPSSICHLGLLVSPPPPFSSWFRKIIVMVFSCVRIHVLLSLPFACCCFVSCPFRCLVLFPFYPLSGNVHSALRGRCLQFVHIQKKPAQTNVKMKRWREPEHKPSLLCQDLLQFIALFNYYFLSGTIERRRRSICILVLCQCCLHSISLPSVLLAAFFFL